MWRASVASARELSGVNWRAEAEVSSPTEQSPKKRKRKKLLMIVDMNRPSFKSKIDSVKKSND